MPSPMHRRRLRRHTIFYDAREKYGSGLVHLGPSAIPCRCVPVRIRCRFFCILRHTTIMKARKVSNLHCIMQVFVLFCHFADLFCSLHVLPEPARSGAGKRCSVLALNGMIYSRILYFARSSKFTSSRRARFSPLGILQFYLHGADDFWSRCAVQSNQKAGRTVGRRARPPSCSPSAVQHPIN